MMRLWIGGAFILLGLLAACEGMPTVGVVPTVTFIPAYIETPQAAHAQAQATLAAGEGRMAELAVQATEVSLQMTQAAATDEAVRRLTSEAIWTTATAAQWAVMATQQERAALQTRRVELAQAENERLTQAVAATAQARLAAETQTAFGVTQAAAKAEIERIEEERQIEQATVLWRTWSGKLLGAFGAVLIMCVIGYMIWRIWPVILVRVGVVRYGPNGKPYFAHPIQGGGLALVDMNRAFGPGIVISADGHVDTQGFDDARLQNGVTERSQAVEMAWAMDHSGRRWTSQTETNSLPDIPIAHLPESAPWSLFTSWQGQALPVGMGADGLITVDPETHAHLLVAGTTGSGKTRYGLRPVITGALAAGWLVAIFDRSGLDFLPFRDHANARVILLDNPVLAIGYLAALYAEIQRRFRLLTMAGVSTWGRLEQNGPRVLAVFDEFSNLADALNSGDREELWRQARMVAAEERKAGIHLALALQDPSHRSIDLRIRRNMTPVAFRVRDGDASRLVLNAAGAETLPPRQFIMANGFDLVRGVGFSPSDAEIAAFLAERHVAQIVDAEWLEMAPAPQIGNSEIQILAERIRSLWLAGESKRRMAQSVGQEYAGAFCRKLDQAIQILESGGTTTTTALPGAL